MPAVSKKKVLFFLFVSFFLFLFFWTYPTIHTRGTIKIWDRNGTLLYESVGALGEKRPIRYADMPVFLRNAAIASEDVSFWNNPGIDSKAMIRSLYLNIREGAVISGASTITQQLARASVISNGKPVERNFLRKFREIIIALRLSAGYSKKDILAMYLNVMYFGNGAYGVEAAANTYFNKSANQLSLAESALLVGLLSSPDTRNPFTNLPGAKRAQERVLDRMAKNNFISEKEKDDAKKETITLADTKNSIKAPHFVHFILEQLEEMTILPSEGINVRTTLDYPTYTLSQTIASLWVEKLKKEHDLSNASLVLLRNETGEIVSMLGGVDYFDTKHSGEVNMATALRQPGSAMKPVTYATAFMKGYTPATVIEDVKKTYQTKKGEGYSPNNYDGRFHGLVTAREALASSFNLPAGVYEFTYRVRATTPGRYHYPPAQAYQMYVPDVSGHSAGGWLDVK